MLSFCIDLCTIIVYQSVVERNTDLAIITTYKLTWYTFDELSPLSCDYIDAQLALIDKKGKVVKDVTVAKIKVDDRSEFRLCTRYDGYDQNVTMFHNTDDYVAWTTLPELEYHAND